MEKEEEENRQSQNTPSCLHPNKMSNTHGNSGGRGGRYMRKRLGLRTGNAPGHPNPIVQEAVGYTNLDLGRSDKGQKQTWE